MQVDLKKWIPYIICGICLIATIGMGALFLSITKDINEADEKLALAEETLQKASEATDENLKKQIEELASQKAEIQEQYYTLLNSSDEKATTQQAQEKVEGYLKYQYITSSDSGRSNFDVTRERYEKLKEEYMTEELFEEKYSGVIEYYSDESNREYVENLFYSFTDIEDAKVFIRNINKDDGTAEFLTVFKLIMTNKDSTTDSTSVWEILYGNIEYSFERDTWLVSDIKFERVMKDFSMPEEW